MNSLPVKLRWFSLKIFSNQYIYNDEILSKIIKSLLKLFSKTVFFLGVT